MTDKAKLQIPEAARSWMRKIARVGGLAGGPARARALSPERRVEIARIANAARQAKAAARRDAMPPMSAQDVAKHQAMMLRADRLG